MDAPSSSADCKHTELSEPEEPRREGSAAGSFFFYDFTSYCY